METSRIKNRMFTSSRGNEVVVWNEKEVGTNVTGMRGYRRSIRTFAVVQGVEIDMDPGCSYQAEGVVHAAGH